jgi:SRSO17 transposase
VCLLSLSKGRWVAADSVYGSGAVEMALRRARVGYVLGVTAQHQFCSWIGKPPVAGTAKEIAHGLDPAAWQRLSAGAGTNRLYDWVYCELADLDAAEYDPDRSGLWTRGLLIRRNIADSERIRVCAPRTGAQARLNERV